MWLQLGINLEVNLLKTIDAFGSLSGGPNLFYWCRLK